jgi:hypothetical protein
MAKQRIRLTPSTRPAVLQAVATAPDGYYVSVEEAKRNLEQNAKMWAMLADISRQVVWTVNGHAEKLSPEEWKTILTASLRQEQRMAPGIRGGFVMLGASTREMTIREMTEVIEILYAFGADHDVLWSEKAAVPGWLQ